MLVMRGPLAYTHFRLERWLKRINDIVPQVNSLSAEFLHFVELEINTKLSKQENQVLSDLLDYGPKPLEAIELKDTDSFFIFVVPNGQSFSHWQKNAIDIAHACGLKQIKQIERGIVYGIEAHEDLTWGDVLAIGQLLHDPEIEQVFYQLKEVEDFFNHLFNTAPKSLSRDYLKNHESNQSTIHLESSWNKWGYCIPNLYIPGFQQPWEKEDAKTSPSGLEILLESSLKRTERHNIEGIPSISGYVKTLELTEFNKKTRSLSPLSLGVSLGRISLEEAMFRLLRLPSIADKSFLITTGDRTATGLVARDPMVGPWQVPVSNCSVLASDFNTLKGQATAIGERISVGILNPDSGRRMAIGEAITNIVAAEIRSFEDISYEYLNKKIECEKLAYQSEHQKHEHEFVVKAEAEVENVRSTLTPELVRDFQTLLIFIDLSGGHQRLGGSALSQVYQMNQSLDFILDPSVPDSEDPRLLRNFFECIQKLKEKNKILAYHDRSDGGLWITLCEMAFASHVGLQIDITELGTNEKSILFNEELGAVIQVKLEDYESVLFDLEKAGLPYNKVIASLNENDRIIIVFNEEIIFSEDRIILQKAWSETSYYCQSIRDNPRCAKKQYEKLDDREDPGLNVYLTFMNDNRAFQNNKIRTGTAPKIAILKEKGVYATPEMSAAFATVGFDCIEVSMDDLQTKRYNLSDFKGVAVCDGASFDDVLGAGQGWAKRILFNPYLRDQFEAFFNRIDTFTLGVSNGCQMLSYLKTLIPGSESWPTFAQNYSEQFESRWCLVEVQPSPSIFLRDMQGSCLMIPVAHAEGRAVFSNENVQEEALKKQLVTLRYVDHYGRKTNSYPANPSGSPLGITGLTTLDGRVTILMPEPERAFRTVQHSWYPMTWDEYSPWLKFFQNAKLWVE